MKAARRETATRPESSAVLFVICRNTAEGATPVAFAQARVEIASPSSWGRIAAALMMRGIAAGDAAKTGAQIEVGTPVMLQVNVRVAGDLDAFLAKMDKAAPIMSHVPELQLKL